MEDGCVGGVSLPRSRVSPLLTMPGLVVWGRTGSLLGLGGLDGRGSHEELGSGVDCGLLSGLELVERRPARKCLIQRADLAAPEEPCGHTVAQAFLTYCSIQVLTSNLDIAGFESDSKAIQL